MTKLKYLAALIAVCSAVTAGCSSGSRSNTSDSSTPAVSSGQEVHQNDLAQQEQNVSAGETAQEHNSTIYTLNSVASVVNSEGDGKRYIYLNVTVTNPSSESYELNALNNFFILLADGTEIPFDIPTQIYAANNLKGYNDSPFTVPAGDTFTGYIGGFILDPDVTDFTVCFFPTGASSSDKSVIVKTEVSAADILDSPADLIG